MKAKTVILGVTGSIAAYKACDIIGALKKASFAVKTVLTRDGANFITALTLQTLSGSKVYSDMFEPPKEWEPVHTSLADEASLILIAPATAAVIGKLASGICDDLLTCVAFASKAPVLIAPAMNNNMYEHPAVKENIARLKKIGYDFIGPVKGRLACGCTAIGHIAPVEDIVSRAKKLAR